MKTSRDFPLIFQKELELFSYPLKGLRLFESEFLGYVDPFSFRLLRSLLQFCDNLFKRWASSEASFLDKIRD